MDIEKFEAINNKMNKITKELAKNTDLGEELLSSTKDLAEVIESAKPPKAASNDETDMIDAVVDVDNMIEDFSYMRAMLRETTQNSKRVLESVTEELMLSEEDNRASLIVAFSELNKAQLEGIKLFMLSYKEISVILSNFAKVRQANAKAENPSTVYTTNVLNMETPLSSADIINRLRQ